ncbi:MAG: hypothetical protein K1X49_05115 [Saprospiraceae bacterium]|nr:hypothetical protein [Saprospiraceae bacterium]
MILISTGKDHDKETYFAIKTDHFVECHVNIRSKLSGEGDLLTDIELYRPMLTNEDVLEEIISMCCRLPFHLLSSARQSC